ncbi:SDR family NAD(P)-dependent oxidoreductase [Jiangella asiatica]|uniref:SDR family NAD(P)-dependent oxidoreductase n=1 Tax=Jiangella asiatica TaxID=2530372 RepID=A0A4R5DPZ0_9ACTN|nr:SDR family NAD(P)-dependent oxidoreductase [Jiangella asiatica]TDE14284.1 SDR family NAD(P)-dependent oxidoreductase [Jiangella asiatica]
MSSTKNAVVTGATSGIGEAIARNLATDGVRVTLVGRSDDRLARTRGRIVAAVPDADLRLERADLSLLGDVRRLAERLASPPPDIVVSNAAVVADVADRTPEGHQRTLATNHLAPYLLLRSLVDPIGARRARFVVVGASPRGLARTPVDLDDLELHTARGLGAPRSFRPFIAYARTKNMNAMFVYALARRLEGSGITVNGAHPGIIRGTHLGRSSNRGLLRAFAAISHLFSPGGPDVGADTPTWLATAPEVDTVTGQFFVKRRAVATAPHTTDPARCDRLWDESARLVGQPAAL